MLHLTGTTKVARVLAWIGGGLILACAILVTLDILLRYLFNSTFGGIDELSGFAYAVGGSWAMSHAMLKKAHVRVDFLYRYFPAVVRPLIDIAAVAALAVVIAVLSYHALATVEDSIRSDTRTISAISFPLAIPQVAWLIGLIFFFLCLVQLLISSIAALVRGDVAAISERIGPLTGEAEVEEELEMVRRESEYGNEGVGS